MPRPTPTGLNATKSSQSTTTLPVSETTRRVTYSSAIPSNGSMMASSVRSGSTTSTEASRYGFQAPATRTSGQRSTLQTALSLKPLPKHTVRHTAPTRSCSLISWVITTRNRSRRRRRTKFRSFETTMSDEMRGQLRNSGRFSTSRSVSLSKKPVVALLTHNRLVHLSVSSICLLLRSG